MEVSPQVMSCLYCGQSVHIPKYRRQTFRFCSRRCGYRWHAAHNGVTVRCRICSTPFTVIAFRAKTAKYCSRRCYYKALVGRGTVLTSCRHCQKPVRSSPSHPRIYCSRACNNKAAHLLWDPHFTTVRKQLATRGALTKCESCGFDAMPEILGVHHKDHNRENNTRENLAVLCPNCHSMVHRQHIPH